MHAFLVAVASPLGREYCGFALETCVHGKFVAQRFRGPRRSGPLAEVFDRPTRSFRRVCR